MSIKMDEAKFQALSEIIVPPGSTSADLQAAIDSAALGDVIIISSDMPFTDTGMVTIAEGKEITIQSDQGNNWIMSAHYPSTRHFAIRGRLVLQNITLDGGGVVGGIEMFNAGSLLTLNDGAVIQNCTHSGVQGHYGSRLIMNNGAVIQNCNYSHGGGVMMENDSTFTMNGGSIINNRTHGDPGGGVLIMTNSTFVMYGGLISGNYAFSSGGGVALMDSAFTMSGGTISGNQVEYRGGGGVSLYPFNSTFIMTGGIITENESINGNGGGILFFPDSTVNISGESYITNNSALNGEGGGIYVDENGDYSRLTIAGETIFSCNRSQIAYNPPENARTLYPNILFASTSIADHPLNNYDIGYTGGELIEEVTFHVVYNANGGSGSYIGSEIISGETDLVLPADQTGISRTGFTFTVWNTEPDGSGASYAPGDTIILDCSTVLFAQWVAEPKIYTVTYNCNGGSGGYIDYCRELDVNYTVLSTNQTGISRANFLFIEWNTQADGSGISYASREIIIINSNVILYAQWRQIPQQKRLCRTPETKCRQAIEGQKLWIDDDNAGNTRPPSVEIILLRDGEVYKRTNVDSTGDGYFGFCCLPVWKNSRHKYDYQIDETEVPGYTKTIEGYNVINTLAP